MMMCEECGWFHNHPGDAEGSGWCYGIAVDEHGVGALQRFKKDKPCQLMLSIIELQSELREVKEGFDIDEGFA